MISNKQRERAMEWFIIQSDVCKKSFKDLSDENKKLFIGCDWCDTINMSYSKICRKCGENIK